MSESSGNILLLSPSSRADWLKDQTAAVSQEYLEQRLAEELAGDFFTGGIESTGEFMKGDLWGRQMYLAGMAMGAVNGHGIALFGDPGGGKSLLLENGHKIIEGIEEEHVAIVPHNVELTVAQLLGEQIPMITEGTDREGNTYVETLSAIIRALIKHDTKIVEVDESNRGNPFIAQALLKVQQKGRAVIYKEGKAQKTDIFDLMVFSENHYGTEDTIRHDPASINRRAMGAFLGMRPKVEQTESGLYVARSGHSEGANYALEHPNDPPQVDEPEVRKVIDLEGLHLIREGIHRVKFGEKEIDLVDKLSYFMLEKMQAEGLRSADNRIVRQIMRISQTLSLLNKRVQKAKDGSESVVVADIDVKAAINYSMTARMASLGNNSEDHIRESVDQVLAA